MIFNKFLKKKKWLSDKVSDRIAAVAEMDISDHSNKSILHELAFNDGEEQVRRAALVKLDDFSLFWQAFKKDTAPNIHKLAEKALTDNLTGVKNSNLDDKLKREFIRQCTKTQLIEKVLFQLGDQALITETILKLNKPSLTYQSLVERDLSDESRAEILATVKDEEQLKRLSKKLSGTLLEHVQEELYKLEQNRVLPARYEKQAKLVLAQLNALKDKSDIGQIEQAQQELNDQWQKLDISILKPDVAAELEQKYKTISASIARINAPRKQAWLEQQALEQIEAQQRANFDLLMQKLVDLEGQLSQAALADKEFDSAAVGVSLNRLEQELADTELSKEDAAVVVSKIQALGNTSQQLPLIKQSVETAKSIIAQMGSVQTPDNLLSLNEINPQFKELKAQWRANKQAVSVALPAPLEGQYDELLASLQPAFSSLEKEQNQLFSQTKRKFSELERLIQSGKFHSAFGLFKKLGFWLSQLSEKQTGQLQRKWQQLTEQVEHFQELERSFSNPKKLELIEQIRKLANEPLADPTEQAHRVKLLRSNWLSLGHSADEEESKLNSEFDELCELAFAPCRTHYKGLEDERQNHYENKLVVIEQLETLASNLAQQQVQDWKAVEALFVKLTKLWRETGLIDRDKVTDVNKRYNNSVKPIRAAIKQYHSDNASVKSSLIAQAEAIALGDSDVKEKVNELKALQNKWRQVGFAGPKLDQSLWTEFRAINNPIFDQRDSVNKSQKAQANKAMTECESAMTELLSQIEGCGDLKQLHDYQDEAKGVFSAVSGLAKADFERLKKQYNWLTKQAEQRIKDIRSNRERQAYERLFDAVLDVAEGRTADLSALKPSWQTAFNQNAKLDRSELTLQIEICADRASPSEFDTQRNQVQLAMLSAKLEQGMSFDLEDLLQQWLSAGVFEQTDIELLNRIRPIYC